MFSEGQVSPNIMEDSGDIPRSRRSSFQERRKPYSDNAESKSDGSPQKFRDSPGGDDEPGFMTPSRSSRKPSLRGSRTIKLDLLVGLDDAKEDPEDDLFPMDLETEIIEFKDEDIDDVGRNGSGPRSPSMDNARVFAMTMLAETERRRSQRSLACDDASVHSVGSSSASMKWPRRGRRSEFPGLRGAGATPPNDLGGGSGTSDRFRWMSRTREGLLKLQAHRRCEWIIRVAIFLVAVALCVCFSLLAHKSRSSNEFATVSTTSEDKMRLKQVVDILVDNNVSTKQSLNDPTSPQHKALSWLVLEDTEQISVNSTQFIQRYTLAVLYYAWGGPEWVRSFNFLSSQHECGWFESMDDQDGMASAIGVTCDQRLQVLGLNMASNNLDGSIPAEIEHLVGLEYIGLGNNSLTGPFPASFAALGSLEFIDFRYNKLSGSIPAYLGDFSQLAVLGLSQNQLTGELPTSLGSLRLRTLAIDDNLLEGEMGAVAFMKDLEYLYAGSNNFRGPIDNGLLADLAHLIEVDLSNNSFVADTIPPALFMHPRLQVLDLHDNQINGTFPSFIPNNHAIKFLSLRGNSVSSSIPSLIGNLQALTHLDLESNSLTGTFPGSDLAPLTKLKYLFLGKNPMKRGPIPNELQDLKALKELSLHSLSLSGTIPVWLENFSGLKLLDLRVNSLDGPVPINFANLPELEYLLLNDNLLDGGVPASLEDHSQLKVVSLHHNTIYGEATGVCDSKSSFDLLTTDCESIECPCCPTCCRDEHCFEEDLGVALENGAADWEKTFIRSDYGFSPSLLNEF